MILENLMKFAKSLRLLRKGQKNNGSLPSEWSWITKLSQDCNYGPDDGHDPSDGRVDGGTEAEEEDGEPPRQVRHGAQGDRGRVEHDGQIKNCLK